ncbi:hypothetical protein [Rhodovulum sp. YEN HP10]|uniref:hypothetical protein n=1 Tax=Rhodovulum sp. HP10 TaxID=3387397 RepID=UPI0039E18C02
MDAKDQAEGEKRVRALLIEPLLRRGLVKSGKLTKARFEEMLVDVEKRLAYMSASNLAALEEQMAALAGGEAKDIFPTSNRIRQEALKIQKPDDRASPLMRAVFKHPIGQGALTEGWAPELLDELRDNRVWPGTYVLGRVRDEARGAILRLDRLRRIAPADLTDAERRWLAAREQQMEECRRIADLAGTAA